MIRVAIIDDEPLAHEILQEYLMEDKDIEVVGNYYNGFEGIKGIQETNPDLIFLDIQMPKINGFEMLELIDNAPSVIFVTAFDTFAVKAFEVHAMDYLMKPYSKERLSQALLKYRSFRNEPPELSNVAYASAESDILERVVVKTGNRIEVIPVHEILYLAAEDDYVAIQTPKGKFLKLRTLKTFEQMLDPKYFVRVHRSYIINLKEVTRIENYEKGGQCVWLKSGAQIPVSKQGSHRLKVAFDS
ncbi:LytR/AlgR family response regulator transcription factor [Lunatibacter salilacus]|uniref:LytR/AlgR family response regulator transcription factor n=1 Tax=Lunatibacter salilacus TaxID=2483804 RepID=UPI00131C3A1F|nr:LytTR family transcriptional regulator DNA-binding domain-containing protein [Lunatibacter salilacus]